MDNRTLQLQEEIHALTYQITKSENMIEDCTAEIAELEEELSERKHERLLFKTNLPGLREQKKAKEEEWRAAMMGEGGEASKSEG